MDAEKIFAVFRALEREGVRYKVVGGVALNLRGLVRATEDLDLFIDPTEDNVSRLIRALKSVFEDPELDSISASDLRGEYPAIEYVPPEGTFSIDLLARLGTAFGYEDITTSRVDTNGLSIEVATPAMLYAMKRDTVRLQDKADAARLKAVYDLPDG